MPSTRRPIALLLVAPVILLAGLALPPAAGAVVYCVPDNTIDPYCETAQGTIAAALAAAEASVTVEDTVRIGAGSYSEAGLLYNSGGANVIHVIGAGTTMTALTIPNTTGNVTGLLIAAPSGSTLEGVTMTIPANADANGDKGVWLTDATLGQNLVVDGPLASNATGVDLDASASLVNSTVDLPFASPGNRAVLLGNATTTISDLTLHANTGVRHGGTGYTATVERSTIEASTDGVSLDSGAIVVRNTVIDLGTGINAVGVQAANFNMGTDSITATLDGVTIVGGGTNSIGVQAQGDSDATVPLNEPGDMTTDGETATATVTNTVISGPTTSVAVQADRGETATLSIDYSNYSAPTIQTNDLGAGGGTGTATLTETNHTTLSPGFVSATDFHLASGSALIDIGDPAAPPGGALDLDGDDRELDGTNDCVSRRDIGAEELLSASPTAAIASGPAEGAAIENSTPTFAFTSSRACAPAFRCSLDGADPVACPTPFAVNPALGDGAHTFAVQALGELGDAGTATSRTFSVDTTAPQTTIQGPRRVRTRRRRARARFTLGAGEGGASFECKLDRGPFVPCSSPFRTPRLLRGRHTLKVRATDPLGHMDATPAVKAFRIVRRAPRR
jgi:hypothetical protein